MHPILGSARRRTLYLASWTVIGLLVAVAWSAANPEAGIVVALAVVVPPCLVQGFVCLSAWYVCRAAPLGARSMVRALAMHTGAGMVAAAVWVTVWAGWAGVLGGLPALDGVAAGGSGAQFAAVFAAGVLLFWLSSLLHYLLVAFEESRGAEARELGLEVLAREAELRALRAQIDPALPVQRAAVDQRADGYRSRRRSPDVPAAGGLLPEQRAARGGGTGPAGRGAGDGPRLPGNREGALRGAPGE